MDTKTVARLLMAAHNEKTRLQQQSQDSHQSLGECEFCGEPATKIEKFDRDVPVCDLCSAEAT